MPRIHRIPRIAKTMFPDQMFMNRYTGKLERLDFLPDEWDKVYPTHIPVQGPELPYTIEQRRQAMLDAQRAYEHDLAEEESRYAYNRKNIAQAVKMRKNELWRQYMEAEDPTPGIGWPEGKAERLDAEFEEQANWDVRGLRNPNEYPGPPDWDFREYYKYAPWRMW